MSETTQVVNGRTIGDVTVSPVALGGASWAFSPDPGRDEYAIRSIHTAIDCGITMIDTARAYTDTEHPGYSEAMVRAALASHPRGSLVLVTTKGGHYRQGDEFPVDGRPETLRRHCELSLELLGVDRIELYQLHCPDPEIPLETSLLALKALQDEGLIRYIGLNSVDVAQVEMARSLIPVTSVQKWFGPANQGDRELLDYCAEQGIPYLAFSVLRPAQNGPLVGLSLNEAFPKATAFAEERGISVERLALAWVLSVSPTTVVITGASRPETITDSALAGEVELTHEDLSELDFSRGQEA